MRRSLFLALPLLFSTTLLLAATPPSPRVPRSLSPLPVDSIPTLTITDGGLWLKGDKLPSPRSGDAKIAVAALAKGGQVPGTLGLNAARLMPFSKVSEVLVGAAQAGVHRVQIRTEGEDGKAHGFPVTLITGLQDEGFLKLEKGWETRQMRRLGAHAATVTLFTQLDRRPPPVILRASKKGYVLELPKLKADRETKGMKRSQELKGSAAFVEVRRTLRAYLEARPREFIGVLTAEPGMSWDAVVSAADALRYAGDGASLLTTVVIVPAGVKLPSWKR